MIHESFRNKVKSHFDSLASQYDVYKKKNWFYYDSLKKFIAEAVPAGSTVLEIGTGTGEILNALNPSQGIGIDISPKMIEIARSKFPHLEFLCTSFEEFKPDRFFEYIVLADVIEHVDRPHDLFQKIRIWASTETRVVLTMANPLWEPLLLLLEKLRLKMPEGPHHRVSEKELLRIAQETGFRAWSKDLALLLPSPFWGIAGLINRTIGRWPWIKRFSLIERFIFIIRS